MPSIRRSGTSVVAALLAGLLLLAGCSTAGSPAADAADAAETPATADTPTTTDGSGDGSGEPPEPTLPGVPPAPSGVPGPQAPLDPEVVVALERLVDERQLRTFDSSALETVVAGGDPRVAWFLADLLRFVVPMGDLDQALLSAIEDLTGTSLDLDREVDHPWVATTNLLLAWDLPVWDGYRELKGRLFQQIEPAWQPFFEAGAEVDWRWVTWGGVRIDDRPFGDPGPCPQGCIPALDDPATTDAAGGDWYPDDRIVFGISLDGASLALPKHQMEVHEMVNLTLAGHDLGIPYCTLCGSAQAYRTAELPDGFDRAVLRTSGLLSRSNKMMYDLTTGSLIDTFTGEALSGPLHDAEVTLPQITVVASTWGAWRDQHPKTRILAEDGGVGRSYPLDPLGGRDDDGPIFPVGPVDPRLPTQESVVGVVRDEAPPVAFPVAATRRELRADHQVLVGDLEVHLDGDGLRVEGPDGTVTSHQAFWFAWSQFHPSTEVWSPEVDR